MLHGAVAPEMQSKAPHLQDSTSLTKTEISRFSLAEYANALRQQRQVLTVHFNVPTPLWERTRDLS